MLAFYLARDSPGKSSRHGEEAGNSRLTKDSPTRLTGCEPVRSVKDNNVPTSTASQTNLTELDKEFQLQEGEELIEEEEHIPDWVRCSPADLYFKRDRQV